MRNIIRIIINIELLLIIAFSIFLFMSCLSRDDNSDIYCWVMEKDPPKGTVPVWLSTHDDYGKSCEELKKMTPLEAFLAVSTL